MRIFLGTEEVAAVLSGLNEGFLELGHETTTYVSLANKYYNVKYDIEKGMPIMNALKYSKRKWPFIVKRLLSSLDYRVTPYWLNLQTSKLIREHDLFVFIWRPWVHESRLFQKIKKAGKKIICVHLGSDVRDAGAYQQEFNVDVSRWDKGYHGDLNARIRKIRYHELYADGIYSIPDQAGLSIRPYKHIYLPLRQQKKIQFKVSGRDEPVIVHAPTNSSIKGTDTILRTLDQLKNEGYKFEIKLLQNMPNEKLLLELENADLLVDELVLHGPGVLSMEAMAAGCAVATKTIDRYHDIYDPPVCIINEETILDRLRHLISDKERRIELAYKGEKFVKEHNKPSRIAENMLNDLTEFQPHYFPTFYTDQYELPPGVSLTVENKDLTKRVLLKTSHLTAASVMMAVNKGLSSPFSEQEYLQFSSALAI